MPQHSLLLVPFGAKDWSADRVTVTENNVGELLFDCAVSHVVLDIANQVPLRLNSDWYRLHDRPPVADLVTSTDQFVFIKSHLPIYCDVWDKFQQMFLVHYFDFIKNQIVVHEDELREKLSGMESLFSVQDWLLSAFLPLPQALIYVPDDPTDLRYRDEDVIRVPLMFWTGGSAWVFYFVGNDSRSTKLERTQSKLQQAGYQVVEIEQAIMKDCETTSIDQILPPEFHNFWEGEILPAGPFKPKLKDLEF